MKKFATPMTLLPGGTPIMDESGLKQATDKRGRPLWEMPRPSGFAVHKGIVEETVDGKKRKVKRLVQVPIYRGISAKFFNKLKANARRHQRLVDQLTTAPAI